MPASAGNSARRPELGATEVPVGLAWQRFLRNHDQPALHNRDWNHPTLAGPYLAACASVTVLFKESPIGIEDDVTGFTEKDRDLLQRAAWQVCIPISQQRRG